MSFRLLIGCLLIWSCSLFAAEKDEFSLNLNEVDMRVLIDTVADITGKNFIVDPHVAGKVSVVTSRPMRASQIYEIFLSILKVHGYAAAGDGNMVRIIQNINAKQEHSAPSSSADGLLTRIVQIHHVDAVQLVQILLPLMPQHAFMSAFPDSNVIVMSDTVGNVNRLAEMIGQIDKNGDLQIELISLQHADAVELVKTLTSLISSRSPGKAGLFIPSLVADDRTNTILLGGDPASRMEMRALIANLDHPVENIGDTEVIYLHYALAKDLVETLTGTKATAKSDINQPKTEGNTQKDVDIRADESTNALVIRAPDEQMRSLKAVVRQLDIRRAQVHIEAIIAEVNYTKDQELGVEWHTKQLSNGVSANTFTNNLGDFVTNSAKTMSVGYLVGGELRALLAAFAKDNNVNILSTPSLVTLDNEEASMIVGQNIGILSGSFTTATSGASNPFQTVQRQDVGIKLNVTPQINEGNAIKLKVKQEVSSVDQTTASSPSGVSIDKREIDTSVLVDDGKILVLGGLMQDRVEETITKVPLLGDIPFLGRLFQDTSTAVTKKNLMVFLRPEIMRDPDKAALLTSGKYNDMRNREQQAGKDGVFLMPKEHGPLLPKLAPAYPKRPVIAP
ncbi:MAG: type II secretion system secretin GspD [Methylovulum sp.]|nr:type II secretion system secretin GspD [Methylovulum sp.]